MTHCMIDTHAHIYVSEFDADRPQMMERALQAGVSRILLPGIDETSLEPMLALCRDYPAVCFPMLALHPGSVDEHALQTMDRLESRLDDPPWVAIGETGIDLYWDTKWKDLQMEVFRRHIGWARAKRLPLVIHSRNAHRELTDVLRSEQDGTLTGVFHCFGGSFEQARDILDLGFYLGIGGVVTFKNARLAKVVAQTGISRLVLETDAPYLAPDPYRGKRNEPAYLEHIVAKIAAETGHTPEEVKQATTRNAQQLFFP